MNRASTHRVLAALLALALGACGSSSNKPLDGAPPADGSGHDAQGGTGGKNADATGVAGSQGNDGNAGNTDAHQQADCGAITLYPPVITVQDAVTGAPICDPTFTVDWPDGGAGSKDGMPYACGQSMDLGCPGPPDGGTAPCAFALVALSAPGTKNVEVTKPGYDTVVVPVMNGQGGCVPYVPASHPIVKLHPLADASTDGG
jgi:hypothetical protein